MNATTPRQRHHVERLSTNAAGQPVTIVAKSTNGVALQFDSLEAAQREAQRRGGRAAGYRVITTFVDDGGNSTSLRMTTAAAPKVCS